MKISKCFRGVRREAPSVSPPTELPPPEKALLPLRDGAGQALEPAAKPGQRVLRGEVVGVVQGSGEPVLLAPLSGTVEGIGSTCDPAGQPVPALILGSDGQDALATAGLPVPLAPGDLAQLKPAELLARAEALGMGLTPTCGPKKYTTHNGVEMVRGIKFLIIKAVDADPPVNPNQACLAGDPAALELGVAALAHLAGAEQVLLALPKDGAFPQIEETARGHRWEIRPVDPGHYPYALDHLLAHDLTGRMVATPDGDPRDMGVLTVGLANAWVLGRALASGRPADSRVVAVAGDVQKPQAFLARVGTPLQNLIAAAGGLVGEPGKVLVGGPMVGAAQYDLEAPVTAATPGIFVQAKAKLSAYREHPCINCGRCVQVCPVGLLPGDLSRLCEYGQPEVAAERDLFHCIECGCCAYVCPARRPLVQLLRLGKSELLAKRMAQ